VTGRLWVQLGGLRKEARYPFLLVEGADIDDGPLSPASLRGACLRRCALGSDSSERRIHKTQHSGCTGWPCCASTAQVHVPVSRSQHRCERQDRAT
jgi:hypothetical protein